MQRYCDYHIHSTFSGDGRDDLLSQVKASRDAGVYTLCFTEHIDLDQAGGDFTVDFPAYRKAIEGARAAYPDMSIYIGLELGDTAETRDRVVELTHALPLDYKLLSRHAVGGVDPYFGDAFFEHRTRAQAADDYVSAVYDSVLGFPDYDALAHLGYVFKFVQGEGFPPLRYIDCPDLIDAILRHLVQNGKALELNTSRFNAFGDGMPGVDTFRRLRQLGGELVTLGSDAHETKDVAQGFAPAVAQLKDIGFDYITTFVGRKPVMQRI